MPYEEFVAQRLFEPAGMDDSYYCDELAVRDDRAHGYDAASPDSLVRARYLDHIWPYSAGSLCSTVDDLVAWNRALHGGGILKEASYEAMTTPAPLEDGTAIRYAMGLSVDTRGGRRVIAHGGGINGFVSQLTYYPEEELTVVVLQNAAAQPGAGSLAADLAEMVLGPATEPDGEAAAEPDDEPDEVAFDGNLEELVGVYRGPARGRTLTLRVSAESGALVIREGDEDENLGVREGDDDPITPSYRGELRWDDGNVRYVFVRDGDRIAELRMDTGGGHYVLERME